MKYSTAIIIACSVAASTGAFALGAGVPIILTTGTLNYASAKWIKNSIIRKAAQILVSQAIGNAAFIKFLDTPFALTLSLLLNEKELSTMQAYLIKTVEQTLIALDEQKSTSIPKDYSMFASYIEPFIPQLANAIKLPMLSSQQKEQFTRHVIYKVLPLFLKELNDTMRNSLDLNSAANESQRVRARL